MRILAMCAVILLTAAAGAKDLTVPTSERELEARIAVFQQETRLASCDLHDRICAKGRFALAAEAVRLAQSYPDCTDQDCTARKDARLTAANGVAAAYPDPNVPNDLYMEMNRTRQLPQINAMMSYVEEVQRALAGSLCPESVKACAVGRLFYLMEIDELARIRMTRCVMLGIEMEPQAQQACLQNSRKSITAVDTQSRTVLARIVDRFGWPDSVHWGIETDHNAWLIAQDADDDADLQYRFFVLIKAAFERGFTSAEGYAYIADRLASHDRTPQLYGTQGRCTGEGATRVWKPNPVGDEAHLDERRAEAHMEPYAEYRRVANLRCQLTK